jgi:2-polyprenyl-3-methyl-5-hydroxy-6-metoxy-1,4-benzoquinol methylase
VGFDQTWDDIFRSRAWGRYPSEDVIRFVAGRFFSAHDRKQVHILDLGCGGGANTWFLAREGFTVTAIDGSAAAVAWTRDLLQREGCSADVSVGTFLDLPFPDGAFDAVLDCVSIQHNPWDEVISIHRSVLRILKPGGWFFGIMLNDRSTRSPEPETASGNDCRRFRAGTLEHPVFVHLFSHAELTQLLAGYGVNSVETLERTEGGGASRLAYFLVAAQKRPTC